MVKFIAAVIGVIVLYSRFTSGQLDLGEGEPCVESKSGKPGVCTRFVDCPAALNDWNQHDQRPTVCSFAGTMEVVCCDSVTRVATARLKRLSGSASFQQTNTTKSINQLKCVEYSRPVTETISYITLTLDPDPVSLTTPKCMHDKVELIVGGTPVLPGQFPHMVAVGWPSVRGGYDFKCGGSLISDRFVLTAGHCIAKSSRDTDVTSVEPKLIRLGDHDLRPGEFDRAQPVNMRIGRIVKHPDYRPPAIYNDIALMEMEGPVKFNPFVRPACLWQKDDFGGLDSGIVTGWGAISYRGARSDVLLKVPLKLLSNEVCQPLLSTLINRKWKDGFSKEQMCAGDLEGKHDSCQGDSGGPLQVTLEENKCVFYLMGITSFGSNCGAVDGPGVYTRVSSFIPWIESVVWPDVV